MRLPVVRALACTALLVGGISSGVAFAGTIDPIGTVTSVVSTVVGQTTVASDLAGTATGATADTSGSASSSLPTDVTSGLTGSGTESSGGSSGTETSESSRKASASSPGTPRTRFDRLPRRYEILLERIEFGHHVRANLARLQTLLASASPEFRARLLRLIRAEIRRLERGGLTRRERAAVRRLRFLADVVRGTPAGGGATAASFSFREERAAGAGVLSATASGSEAIALRREPPNGAGISSDDVSPEVLPNIPPGPDWWAIAAVVLSVLGAGLLFMLLVGGRKHDTA